MAYRFLEDVAIADIAFEATGKTLSELFQSAAEATIVSMANPKSVKSMITKEIKLKAESVNNLLFDFLGEIIFIKDKDAMVFNEVKVDVDEKEMSLKATLKGDAINPAKQELRNDVKAVTMHYYEVVHEKEWKARVVLDI